MRNQFASDNRKYWVKQVGNHIPMGDSYAMETWRHNQVMFNPRFELRIKILTKSFFRNKASKLRKRESPRPTQGPEEFREVRSQFFSEIGSKPGQTALL